MSCLSLSFFISSSLYQVKGRQIQTETLPEGVT